MSTSAMGGAQGIRSRLLLTKAIVKQTGEANAIQSVFVCNVPMELFEASHIDYHIAFAFPCDWIQTIPYITNKNASDRIRFASLFDKGF